MVRDLLPFRLPSSGPNGSGITEYVAMLPNIEKRKARLNIRRASFCDDITTPTQSLPMVWVTYRSKRDLRLALRPEYAW